MPGLGDGLTIAIVLTLIFGAVGFYLYSRLSQNEKRVSLLENLLLSLKMSTEASLMGPDMVEPISEPSPLDMNDVDDVSEGDYADLLKDLPLPTGGKELTVTPTGSVAVRSQPEEKDTVDTVDAIDASAANVNGEAKPRKMDVNYESLSTKDLTTLAKQRNLANIPSRKRDIIDALKKQTQEFEGATIDSGFTLEMSSS